MNFSTNGGIQRKSSRLFEAMFAQGLLQKQWFGYNNAR